MSRAEASLFTLDVPVFTEHGLFDSQGDLDEANKAMCRLLGEKLATTYPGYPWGVISEIEQGIVKICLQGFTQWPVVIRISSLKGDPSLKLVTKFAGELLERLMLSRESFSMADWQTALRRLPHHFYRNAKAPE